MRYILKIIVIALVVLPSVAQSNGDIFSQEDVRANVVEYLRVVLGATRPTLKDYLKYNGMDPGYESILMLQVCKHKFPGQAPDVSDECGRYIKEMYARQGHVESLYYQLLRKKLAVDSASFNGTKIQIYPASDQDVYRVIIRDHALKHHIVIGHARRRSLADLGFIGVIEVDGRPVNTFLGFSEQ